MLESGRNGKKFDKKSKNLLLASCGAAEQVLHLAHASRNPDFRAGCDPLLADNVDGMVATASKTTHPMFCKFSF
jgi:hypothetical protein